MSLVERVLSEPEFRDDPPVLVDVGAAGGIPAIWRRIARHSTGVGFEPDARETAPLTGAQRMFKRWVFCPGLAVPAVAPGGRAPLHLTRSPQCSSTLRPNAAALGEWAFSGFFEVLETREFPATTLADALAQHGLSRVDWLKCDTQGLDLKLYLSLPPALRARVLAVEFEPGLTDAYEGEDKLADVLATMGREPFWLAGLDVGRTPRGRAAELTARFGTGKLKWVRRLAPGAPAWANARYLRDVANEPGPATRRSFLLGWVFASLAGQHGAALTTAEAGVRHFGGPLFSEMADTSAASLRRAMWWGWPALLWRRLARG